MEWKAMKSSMVRDLENLLPEERVEVNRVIQAYRMSFTNSGVNKGGLHYFGRFLGIHWNENGEALMQLGLNNENTHGVTQGGALYTLADVAIGSEIYKRLKFDDKVFTLEMKINYMKKGTGKQLLAKTEILHWGTTTVVAQCQILNESEEIVAHTIGTFYVVKNT